MQSLAQASADVAEGLIGTWRRFGPTGPVYEVVGVSASGDTERTMRVRVVETGEEIDYRLSALLDDPRAD